MDPRRNRPPFDRHEDSTTNVKRDPLIPDTPATVARHIQNLQSRGFNFNPVANFYREQTSQSNFKSQKFYEGVTSYNEPAKANDATQSPEQRREQPLPGQPQNNQSQLPETGHCQHDSENLAGAESGFGVSSNTSAPHLAILQALSGPIPEAQKREIAQQLASVLSNSGCPIDISSLSSEDDLKRALEQLVLGKQQSQQAPAEPTPALGRRIKTESKAPEPARQSPTVVPPKITADKGVFETFKKQQEATYQFLERNFKIADNIARKRPSETSSELQNLETAQVAQSPILTKNTDPSSLASAGNLSTDQKNQLIQELLAAADANRRENASIAQQQKPPSTTLRTIASDPDQLRSVLSALGFNFEMCQDENLRKLGLPAKKTAQTSVSVAEPYEPKSVVSHQPPSVVLPSAPGVLNSPPFVQYGYPTIAPPVMSASAGYGIIPPVYSQQLGAASTPEQYAATQAEWLRKQELFVKQCSNSKIPPPPPDKKQTRTTSVEDSKLKQKEKTLTASDKVNLEKLRRDRAETKSNISKMRKEKANIEKLITEFKEELTKLRKQENELCRKRQRQKSTDSDPLLDQNTKIQKDIEKHVRLNEAKLDGVKKELKVAERKLSRVEDSISDYGQEALSELGDRESKSRSDQSSPSKNVAGGTVSHEYYDPGGHFCSECKQSFTTAFEMLTHLHSKQHLSTIDPLANPWLKLQPKAPPSSSRTIVKPLKGVEFLVPVPRAYFCGLCKEFSGDESAAEAHVKSHGHNLAYQDHCEENPFYEQRYNISKAAAISTGNNDDDKKKKKKKDKKMKEKKGKSTSKEPSVSVMGKKIDLSTIPTYHMQPVASLRDDDEVAKKKANRMVKSDGGKLEIQINTKQFLSTTSKSTDPKQQQKMSSAAEPANSHKDSVKRSPARRSRSRDDPPAKKRMDPRRVFSRPSASPSPPPAPRENLSARRFPPASPMEPRSRPPQLTSSEARRAAEAVDRNLRGVATRDDKELLDSRGLGHRSARGRRSVSPRRRSGSPRRRSGSPREGEWWTSKMYARRHTGRSRSRSRSPPRRRSRSPLPHRRTPPRTRSPQNRKPIADRLGPVHRSSSKSPRPEGSARKDANAPDDPAPTQQKSTDSALVALQQLSDLSKTAGEDLDDNVLSLEIVDEAD